MHIALHFLAWPLGLAALTSAALAPHWVHALDGARDVPLAATAPVPTAGTRNVALSGFAQVDAAVVVTSTTKMNGGTVSKDERVLVPVTAESWKSGDPVRFVLQAPARNLEHSDDLVRAAAGVSRRRSGTASSARRCGRVGWGPRSASSSPPAAPR